MVTFIVVKSQQCTFSYICITFLLNISLFLILLAKHVQGQEHAKLDNFDFNWNVTIIMVKIPKCRAWCARDRTSTINADTRQRLRKTFDHLEWKMYHTIFVYKYFIDTKPALMYPVTFLFFNFVLFGSGTQNYYYFFSNKVQSSGYSPVPHDYTILSGLRRSAFKHVIAAISVSITVALTYSTN